MHIKNIQSGGKSINESKKVLIMLHGRGGDAHDILGFATHLNVSEFALLAPEATNNSWYPYSFMENPEQNEPWLSSALDLIKNLVDELTQQGINSESIYFTGFSQGACMALEYVTRNAKRYGGVAAFTGALIGNKLNLENYSGNFAGTPIFIGTGNPDSHVPLERVKDSVVIFEKMNAKVYLEVYDGRPHTISQDEIEKANRYIFN